MENTLENRMYDDCILNRNELRFHLIGGQVMRGELVDYNTSTFIVQATSVKGKLIITRTNCIYIDFVHAASSKI